MARVNFDTYTPSAGVLYPNGVYHIQIASIEETKASTGSPQLQIKTNIKEGEFAGKKLTDHITLVDNVVSWKIPSLVLSLGLTIKGLGELDTDSLKFRMLMQKLVNKSAYWQVGQKADNTGKIRNVIENYLPAENPVAYEASNDEPSFLK